MRKPVAAKATSTNSRNYNEGSSDGANLWAIEVVALCGSFYGDGARRSVDDETIKEIANQSQSQPT